MVSIGRSPQKLLPLLAIAAIAMVWTPAARAARANCQAPPGTSALDQYCETIPAAGGDRGTRDNSGARLGQSLSPRSAAALANAGPTGRGVLALPAGSPARGAAANRAGQTGHKGGDSASTPQATSNDPLNAVRSAIASGTRAGSGFVWVLIGIGVFMGALGWIRYRRASDD